MIMEEYSAVLIHSLDPGEFFLPVSKEDKERLLAILPLDEEIWLRVRDGIRSEDFRVRNTAGVLQVIRGPRPSRFPKGSFVRFDVGVEVVKELIREFDRCGDPKWKEPKLAGTILPPAVVGTAWRGTVVFEGDSPMRIVAGGGPDWLTVLTGPNYAELKGTPDAPGTVVLSLAATNRTGRAAAVPVEFEVE
jgi:hypothetical protein